MLLSVTCDAISFFVTRKCQKFEKLTQIVNIEEKKSSCFISSERWRNFNEIFRKDVTYDNIKSCKKVGLHPLI